MFVSGLHVERQQLLRRYQALCESGILSILSVKVVRLAVVDPAGVQDRLLRSAEISTVPGFLR